MSDRPPGSLAPPDALAEFIKAAVWHGPIEPAAAILAANPSIASAGVHVAALLGDAASVRRFLAADPASATAPAPPLGWDPLTHLCFSKYLRLDPARTPGFVAAATALLDAGASPATGFWDPSHRPRAEWESVLYGAAGVAHHPELTRLLLERGADPNDEETPYHAPETYDNRALTVLLESGKLNAGSLATLLLRKADWHDLDGLRLLLDHGADPNATTRWGFTALAQALRRDNHIDNINLLLDRGADPRPWATLAAQRGRRDVLESLRRRGLADEFSGVDRLIAACALGDGPSARAMAAGRADLLEPLRAQGGDLLARFAGNGNSDGIALLLEFGIPVTALYADGDGYYGIAKASTALHVAAWRTRHDTVRFLLSRGAPVNVKDGDGRTPLSLAVRACVDSYWMDRRSPDSVQALLAAGATTEGIPVPCGYDEVDRLLLSARP